MDRRTFSLSLGGLSAAALCTAEPRDSKINEAPLARVSTFTQVGKEEQPFLQGNEAVLAEKHGAGYLDHMWFGGSFPNFTRLRIRVYVDDESPASIDMPLDLGIGVGFGDPDAPWGTRFAGITGSPSGIFLNYPIPFARHVRVTAELPEGVNRDTVFWWIVRGIENMPLQISGIHLPPAARLRLHSMEDRLIQPLEEFDLCRVPGQGMVFQVSMAAKSSSFEFMEGQMRSYTLNGKEPQYLSSGLEDYFLGTYYFNRGLYHLPQAGLTHKNDADNSFSAYRYHDIDPLFFSEGLRLACRCGEKRGDKVFGSLGKPFATTYSTCVWTYEW